MPTLIHKTQKQLLDEIERLKRRLTEARTGQGNEPLKFAAVKDPDLFQTVFNALDEPHILYDLDGAPIRLNKGASDLLGVENDPPPLHGLGDWKEALASLSRRQPISRRIEFQAKDGGMVRAEVNMRLAENERDAFILARLEPLPDKAGPFPPLDENPHMILRRPASPEPALNEEVGSKFELIANASKDSMSLISRDYIYEATNRAYRKAVNKNREEIVGRSVMEIWGEEAFQKHIKEHLDACFRGIEVGYEAFFTFHGLGRGYYEVNYHPYFDEHGEVAHAVVTSHDITKRKQAEEALRKLNENLEQKVIQRTAEQLKANAEQIRANIALKKSLRSLKEAQDQLVQSEKMAALGDLVAGVAHEINTPLGIGVTAASLLDEETRNLTELFSSGMLKRSELEEYLDLTVESAGTILSNLRRAAELIQSFKLVAVDQSLDEKRKFNLKEYIHEILLNLGPKLKRTNHTVAVECPDDIILSSHPGAFMQIITNMVVNSLVHAFETMSHGRIRICVVKDGDRLVMSYSDNGRGMTPEQQKKVFDPFFTTKRGRGGTGLGMHIVYNIITQTLGGAIKCDSSPDQGTTFEMRLPLENQG